MIIFETLAWCVNDQICEGFFLLPTTKIFKKSPQLKKTWKEALDFCRAIGGDLLSLHSSKDLHISRYYSLNNWFMSAVQDDTHPSEWSVFSAILQLFITQICMDRPQPECQ